jgi:hypothetical protein
MLSASSRYSIVDAGSVAGEVISAGGIQHCNGCDGPLAKKLGADQSMIGVFTRVSRVEYTLQILVRDTQTRAVVSNNFTGLRMGANYAWPRASNGRWTTGSSHRGARSEGRVLCARRRPRRATVRG